MEKVSIFFVFLITSHGTAIVFQEGNLEADFLSVVAKDSFYSAKQIIVLYDESWEISLMIKKITVGSLKAFVTYYFPTDRKSEVNVKSRPPTDVQHKLLPKGTAFLVFVKNDKNFISIMEKTSVYPWWSQRARLIIFIRDEDTKTTKEIISWLDKNKIFNGAVVTRTSFKSSEPHSEYPSAQFDNFTQGLEKPISSKSSQSLQIATLDPYPLEKDSKIKFIARWTAEDKDLILINDDEPIFMEKIDNLRGHPLTACVFHFPPLVIKHEDQKNNVTTYSGLETKIFKEIGNLLNFSDIMYEPNTEERWGIDLGNNSWNGLIGQVQRKADIGFAGIFLLDNRDQAVDVSMPYDQDQGCFAVPRPEALAHWLGLILPFSWKVWACLISMAFIAGPMFTIITRPLDQDESFSVPAGIMYAVGSMISVQKAPKAKGHSLRTFIIFWLLFCYLSAITYRVALISSLTVGPENYKIDSIKKLISAELDWGGYPETVMTFNTSNKGDEKLFDHFQPISNITEALDKVTDGDFSVLDSSKYLQYAIRTNYFDGDNPLFHIAKECPTTYNVGFIFPIGSPFLQKFNTVIMRMQNAGLIEKWYKDELHAAEAKYKSAIGPAIKRRFRGLSIGDLKLCFVIFFGGHFLSFGILLMEKARHRYKEKKLDMAAMVEKAMRSSSIFRKSWISRGPDTEAEVESPFSKSDASLPPTISQLAFINSGSSKAELLL